MSVVSAFNSGPFEDIFDLQSRLAPFASCTPGAMHMGNERSIELILDAARKGGLEEQARQFIDCALPNDVIEASVARAQRAQENSRRSDRETNRREPVSVP